MEIIISLLKRQNQEQQKKNLRHDWAEKWFKVAILTIFKVVKSFLHVIFAFSNATKIALFTFKASFPFIKQTRQQKIQFTVYFLKTKSISVLN